MARESTRRIRLVVLALIVAAYSVGVVSLGGVWGVLLTAAGLLAAFHLGRWTMSSRGLVSSPTPAMPSQSVSHAQEGVAESSSASLSPVASQPQEEGRRWSELLQRWSEERLLLPLPGCHYAPPSVVGNLSFELLKMANGLREAKRLRVEPIWNVEEAERYLRAVVSIPAGMYPDVLCVLPIGAIGRLGRARPNLPEWYDALSRAQLRWLGEQREIRLENDLHYFPLVAEFQIRPTPFSSTEIPPHRRRSGLYLGVDTNGNPVFLPWPWHVVVVGRSGSGKTNTLRHLLVEAVLAARWMRVPLIAVSVTAKEDGMAGVLRVSSEGEASWLPLPKDQAEDQALALDPAQPSSQIRLLVVDEAQELTDNKGFSKKVQDGFAMGRANRFAVVLATSNARSEYLPTDVTQHAAWIIHPTDGNEAALLLRRAAVEWSGGMPTEAGEAIFVDRSRREAIRIRVPSNSFGEVIPCGSKLLAGADKSP